MFFSISSRPDGLKDSVAVATGGTGSGEVGATCVSISTESSRRTLQVLGNSDLCLVTCYNNLWLMLVVEIALNIVYEQRSLMCFLSTLGTGSLQL